MKKTASTETPDRKRERPYGAGVDDAENEDDVRTPNKRRRSPSEGSVAAPKAKRKAPLIIDMPSSSDLSQDEDGGGSDITADSQVDGTKKKKKATKTAGSSDEQQDGEGEPSEKKKKKKKKKRVSTTPKPFAPEEDAILFEWAESVSAE